MAQAKAEKAGLKDFPATYWISIIYEFFERGSYYGMMSILAVYMSDYLRFSKEGVGLIMGVVVPFLIYGLPIITGAVADRMGYRKTLLVAFALLGSGYFLTSQMDAYGAFFISFAIMGIGAGTFKPVISGTIAKVTDERTSTLGFGIFYWTINLGAFLFPLILVPMLKVWAPDMNAYDCTYVFIVSGIATGAMLIPTIFIYKEPPREKSKKEDLGGIIKGIFQKVWMVILDWRFILFIFIYSWFWILYFQMFVSVLWYVNDFVNAGTLNSFVNNVFGEGWLKSIIGAEFKFDVEHVTVINAGTIILLQLFISNLVKKTKALPTMLTGIAMGTIGMAILAISSNIWIFVAGIIIFSIGEMTAHPKFISYLGLIAPPDKKATYMGFGFLYGVFGSFIGKNLGGVLYPNFVDYPIHEFLRSKLAAVGSNLKVSSEATMAELIEIGETIGVTKEQIAEQAHTSELWLLFSGIGVICILGLLFYQKVIGTREAGDLK